MRRRYLETHIGSSLRPDDRIADSKVSYRLDYHAPRARFVAVENAGKVLVASVLDSTRLRMVLICNNSTAWPCIPFFLADSNGSFSCISEPKAMEPITAFNEVLPDVLCSFFSSIAKHGALKKSSRKRLGSCSIRERMVVAGRPEVRRWRQRRKKKKGRA